MIEEDYVSFETAKLLKEKGFDDKNVIPNFGFNVYEPINGRLIHNNPPGAIKSPTLQMAMKWLRKEKGIAIIPIISSILDNEKFLWDVKVVVAKTSETYSQGWIYEEPERAYEAAIKYCLENLI